MAAPLSTSTWYSSGMLMPWIRRLTSTSTELRSRPLTSAVTSRLRDAASCQMTVGADTTLTLAIRAVYADDHIVISARLHSPQLVFLIGQELAVDLGVSA